MLARLLRRVFHFWVSLFSRKLTNRYGANRRITGQFASSSDSRRENHDRTLKALPVVQNFDARMIALASRYGRRRLDNRFYGKSPPRFRMIAARQAATVENCGTARPLDGGGHSAAMNCALMARSLSQNRGNKT
jgi:hypothetical protein